MVGGYDRIIIDQHYREKHADSISDIIILKLVRLLEGLDVFEEATVDEFHYLKKNVYLEGKRYRIVLVIKDFEDYLGVVNAFRVGK